MSHPNGAAASRRDLRPDVLRLAFVVALALAVYANTLGNGFVWDDEHIVVGNPATRDIARLGQVLLSADEVRPYYRPLNRASYLVDYRVFGMDPRGFHLVNLLIHAAAAGALYLLARQVGLGRDGALVAAALLAIHPLHTEPVNFITARNNLFALLFSLLCVAAWLRGRELAARGATAAAGWTWAAGGFFFLGLASKEPAVAAGALVAGLAATGWAPGRARERAASLLPLGVALAAYGVLRWVSLRDAPVAPGDVAAPFSGFGLNLYIVPAYARLALFPFGLTNLHEVPAELAAVPWLYLAWPLLVAAGWFALRRTGSAGRFGLAWLALNFLPVANIVPIPSAPMAERYVYLPAAGLWIVAGAAVERWLGGAPRSTLRRLTTWGACAVVAVCLAATTVQRNRDWRDDLAVFSSAVRADPGSVEARFNLGVASKDAGRLEDAARAWEAAVALDPRHAPSLAQLGIYAAVRGDLGAAEGWLARAVEARPELALARFNLALVHERRGRPGEARRQFEAFLAAPGEGLEEQRALARQRLARHGS